jgi:hypothetical protein
MLLKIIGGFLSILGLFFFIKGVIYICEIKNSQSWPYVQGIIVKSELVGDSLTISGDIHSVGVSVSPRKIDSVNIEYHYIVDEILYSATRVGIGDHVGEARKKEILSKYKVGTTIPVYYDPKDPTNAALEVKFSFYNFLGAAIGLFLLGLSTFFFRLLLR